MVSPAQQAALDQYLAELERYKQFEPERLQAAEVGETALAGLQYDPRMLEYEMSALRALEEQGREGLTAQDRAAMAEAERQASQAARGRRGAIQQSMQQRGISGSGLDLVAQLQSAEAANELAAMKALEQGAISAQRRSQGQLAAGQQAARIGERQLETQAQRAAAQDRIRAFNAQNRARAQEFNIGMGAETARQRLGAGQQAAQFQYNVEADRLQREQIEKERKRRQRQGALSAGLGALGGAAGAYFGGPAGAGAGFQIGSALGGAFAKGGVVPGQARVPGDSYLNDTTLIAASPGEVVIPRSIANDPIASAAYVAGVNSVPSHLKKNFANGGTVGDLRLFDVKDIEKPIGPELPPNYVPPQTATQVQAQPQTDNFPGIKNPEQRAALEAIKNRMESSTTPPQNMPTPEEKAQTAKSIFDIFKEKDDKTELTQEKFDLAKYVDQSKDEYQKAKEREKYLALANVLGQSISQYTQAMQSPVALPGRFEDIGKFPQMMERPTYQYQPIADIGTGFAEARKNLELALKYQDEERDRAAREKQYQAQLESQDIQRQIMLMGALGKEGYAQALRGKADLTPYEKAYLDALEKQTALEAKQTSEVAKYDTEAERAAAERRFKEEQNRLDREADAAIRQKELELRKSTSDADRALKKQQIDQLMALKKQQAAATAKQRAAAAAKPKPLTEYDKKTMKFLSAMEKADKDYEALITGAVGYDPANLKDPLAAQFGPLVSKFFVSDAYKRAKQAEAEFVSAKLRDESGAAASEAEFQREAEKYFPRPGNSPEVLAQKTAARKAAIRAMKSQLSEYKTVPAAGFSAKEGNVIVRYKGKLKEIPKARLQEALKLGAEEVK